MHQSEGCPRVPAEKDRPQVLPKYRLSEKKYRSPVIMIILALLLLTITPVKRNAEGYRVPSDVGLTKVFDRARLKGRIRLILVGLYL